MKSEDQQSTNAESALTMFEQDQPYHKVHDIYAAFLLVF